MDNRDGSSAEPTLFEWVGGLPALQKLTRLFYSKYVPADPLLRALFANMAPDHPDRVAAWLGEVFGGPKTYSQSYGGYERMVSQHMNKGITEDLRSRWAMNLYKSADEAGLPADPEFRAAFAGYIEWGSRIALENSQPGARPPAHMPVPRWWWVCEAKPWTRVSALATDEQRGAGATIALPSADETPTFEAHIKPLFRKMDRDSMKVAFDLWAHADVVKYAPKILARLEQGTMPCDGAWPPQRVAVFRRWMDDGMPE